MFTYEILRFPDPVLLARAKELDPQDVRDGRLDRIVRRMIRTINHKKALGLAAPQVGIGCRLFVIATPEGFLVAFNPVALPAAEPSEPIMAEEGCLSLPNGKFWVRRPEGITLQALTREGEPFSVEVHGLLARACQHEIDHLDGVSIQDRSKE